MKIVLIALIFSTFAFAENDWHHYLTDSCFSSQSGDYVYANTNFKRCKDGSVSFNQPGSAGIGGWEGKCGHTMASNMFYTVCNKAVHPDRYFGPLLVDVTPGVKPATMSSGLNRAFQANRDACPERREASWFYIKLGNAKNFMAKVQKYLEPIYSHHSQTYITRDGQSYYRNPVGVLIANPNSRALHWVTVVDQIEKYGVCYYVVNHWGGQYQIPCTTLADLAGRPGRYYPVIMRSYQIVTLTR